MNRFEAIPSRRGFLRQAAVTGLAGAGAIGTARAQTGGTLLPVKLINTAGLQSLTMKDLMVKQQYMQKFGLDPQFLDVVDGNKIVSALISGDADICMFSGFSSVLPAIEKGGGLKILAASLQTPVHDVYAKDPAIKRVADLKGKIIGVGPLGALLHQMMMALLSAKGVDPKSVTFVNAGSAGDVFKAVVAGKIDAGPADFDYLDPKLGVHILEDGEIAKELPEFTFQASYTSDRVIKEKRDTLVRTLAAYSALYRFMESAPGKQPYLDAFFEATGKQDTEEATKQWVWIQSHGAYSADLILSPERVDYAQKLNLATGVQKRLLNYDEATDMSIARDALALVKKTTL